MSLKKGLSVSMAAVMSVGMVASVSSTSEAATADKIIGSGRHETAVKISQKGWKSAENAIIVNDSAIADALAATPFAKNINAPILLTGKNSLNGKTKAELERLGVKNVYIIGGEAVLPSNIEENLSSEGYNVERIKGNTREETAIKIAEKLSEKVDIKEVAVVNGVTGLADAVSVSAAAAQNNMAIILSNKKSGINASKEFIKKEGIKKSYIIGGTAAVSQNVQNSLPNPERISGGNRNITNAKVINKFYSAKNLNNIYVAKDGSKSSSQLVDALAVGVLAAKEKSPVLIVSRELAKEQNNLVKNKKFKHVVQVGGNGNEDATIAVELRQGMKVGLPDYLCRRWYQLDDGGYLEITKDTYNGCKYKLVKVEKGKYIIDAYEDDGFKIRYMIYTTNQDRDAIMLYMYNEVTGYYTGGMDLYSEDYLEI